MGRNTLRNNPLDSVIPDRTGEKTPAKPSKPKARKASKKKATSRKTSKAKGKAKPAPRRVTKAKERTPEPTPEARSGGEKARFTVNLPVELAERARDAVYWTPEVPTLADLVEEALETHLKRMEKKRGEAFPARKGQLKTGRPIR